MDGAGAAASVIAFADAGIKSAKCIREFISIVKDGGQTVALFGQDVDTLATALQRISLLSLNDSSPPTIASLKTHLEACSKELVTYEKLIQGLDRSSPRLANRMRMAARTMWKDKDLEQARNRIRDLNTQLGVYLCLLQAEAAARASLRQTSTAETTRDLLQQILGEFGRVHTRLDGIDTASAAAMNTQDTPVRELTPDSPDVTEACNELQESVSRLASLVDHEEAIIDAEDAHHIIDDLETLIQSARDRVSCTQVENPSSKDQERGGDGRNVRDNIWLAQSLVCSAPVLAINQSVPRSRQLLADVPAGTVISQKRLREEIDIGCGILTIETNKRRRVLTSAVPQEVSDEQNRHRDIVASFLFRPKNGTTTLAISVRQSQLVDCSMMSIPSLFVNPILPNSSPVFAAVQAGRIEELRMMLIDGRASIRDHDENGWGLLHHALRWPEICRLLIEAGVDVDESGRRMSASPLNLTVVGGQYRTTKLLLQHAADPTHGKEGPLYLAARRADNTALGLYIRYSTCFIANESTDALHSLCKSPRCSRSALQMLVDAGADVRRLTEDGRTAFHLLIQAAKPRSGKSNLESLVFLIQKGPSVHALDRQYKSVSTLAYTEDGCADPLGFRGDVWDAALATCGYDLVEFRKDHPRTPRYSQMYLRSHFEVIWGGIEHLCPYWDDEPWPDKYTEGQRHIKELSRLRARDRPLRTLSTKSNLRLS